MPRTSRARGGNRGGCGGGYEQTDPDYNDTQGAKIAADFRKCPANWKETFLVGLPQWAIRDLERRNLIKKGRGR